MIKRPPVNLSPLQKDYAVYLPAISSFYSTYIAKQRQEEFVPRDRIPKGFDRGIEGMNFLNPEEGYFYYDHALYSAGHAQLDIQKSLVQECMIHDRDHSNTMILGDSGGYQIGKGILKFDWLDFEGKAANKVRDDIIAWLELTADWSMTLDVPTWACSKINSPRTGLKTPEECLEKTRYNNEYFLKHRLGKTKWLNVLQGSDWISAQEWYEGVKEFNDTKIYGDQAFEGWAFGGVNMSKMDITLKRLMIMREEGLIKEKSWIHFLGTAQLDWACYLTSIQRQLRKHINEEITISFDCASPFVATAHGLSYTNPSHTSKKFSIVMEKAPDNKALSGSDIPFPFESEIGRRLTMGDICWYAPGMLNKIGKEGKTSWDSFSYALYMSHNVYQHIVAVQRANQLADIESAKHKPDWRSWKKLSAKDIGSDQYSEFIPRNILYFDRFVEELFNTKTLEEAMDMLDTPTAKAFLISLAGARNTSNGQNDNMFGNLFDVEEVTNANEIDVTNPNDEKLADLTNKMLTGDDE